MNRRRPARPAAQRAWPENASSPDLTGKTYGLVTVLRSAPSVGFGTRWLVRCECGHERYLRRGELIRAPRTHRSCVAREAAE